MQKKVFFNSKIKHKLPKKNPFSKKNAENRQT